MTQSPAPRPFPPLSSAECESIGLPTPRAQRASFDRPQFRPMPRPAQRSERNFSAFLLGCVVLMLGLLLATAAGSHISARTAATLEQASAMRGM
ncbi:hypothetical protein ACN9JG_06120 [Cereibacter azotoformans]|uniref:hypothetical protein n=1 Tax=Cereibacter azotoformans TaxID=43057 RepID=UPI003B212FBE